jgi:hypothetical protein
MEPITATTILTGYHSVALYTLSGGTTGMIVYEVRAGDLLVATLLAIMVVFQGLALWRGGRR